MAALISCDGAPPAAEYLAYSTAARAGWIYLDQTCSGLGHSPLCRPNPPAQRDINADAAAFVQHFFCTLERQLRSFNALPGLGQLDVQ